MADDQRQRCKSCGHIDKFDFYVPDNIWADVVPNYLINHVVCLSCFDNFALQNGVKYGEYIDTIYFAGDKATLILKAEKLIND